VLVLDEPTANLDAATEAGIHKTIVDQRNAGLTVIIVTHNPATLAIVDDVIVLDQGALVCCGPIADPTIQASVAEVMRDRSWVNKETASKLRSTQETPQHVSVANDP